MFIVQPSGADEEYPTEAFNAANRYADDGVDTHSSRQQVSA